MKIKRFTLLIIIICFFSCENSNTKNRSEIIKTDLSADTCDSPDADINCIFLNMPSGINNIMYIADSTEPGERIIIKGQILKEDGSTPYSGIVIYAYHTDDKGYYSKKGNETGVQKWHGHLYGFCKTDQDGRYEIHTIRPARYPSNEFPAHIHWYAKEPDGKMDYLNDFVFSDDSLVTEKYISELKQRGDNGVVKLEKNNNGMLEGSRITVLNSK